MTTLGCQRLFICGFLFRLTVIVTARVLGSLRLLLLSVFPPDRGNQPKRTFAKSNQRSVERGWRRHKIMMRMVIGSIDYLQSLRMVTRARMLRVSERARQTHKEEAGKGKSPSPVPFARVWMGYLDNTKHFIFWLCNILGILTLTVKILWNSNFCPDRSKNGS